MIRVLAYSLLIGTVIALSYIFFLEILSWDSIPFPLQ